MRPVTAPRPAFFVTVGTTDLQVRLLAGGRPVRATLGPGVREVHAALLGDPRCWRIAAEDAALPHPAERCTLRRSNGRWEASPPFEVEDSERLALVPAKLPAVCDRLEKEWGAPELAVVFSTHRTASDRTGPTRDEPIAAGPILARWLAERFALTEAEGEPLDEVPLGHAGCVNLLRGGELLRGGGRDDPINRVAVRRLNRAVAGAAAATGRSRACVSDGGGIPGVKDVLRACADFWFGKSRTAYETDPQFGTRGWAPGTEQAPTPSDSFRTRAHAITLIRHGDFAGAAAASSNLAHDEKERIWVTRIRQAADYFGGVSERVIPDARPYLNAVLGQGRPRALTAAMRVEAALAGDRVYEAIGRTLTFFDAALIDAVQRTLRPISIDTVTRTVVLREGPPEPLVREVFGRRCLERFATRGAPMRYRYSLLGDVLPIWLEVLNQPSLVAFERGLQEHTKTEFGSLRNLRNLETHAVTPSALLRKARNAFERLGFWATGPQVQQGSRFMGCQRARPLLALLLDDETPERRYAGLVEGLTEDLENFAIE